MTGKQRHSRSLPPRLGLRGFAAAETTSALKTAPLQADERTVRATILGSVGVLWGGAIVASGILDRTESPDAAHVIGELMALAFGALIFAAGARALVRRYR
ncbi:MAG: hypothetical protein ABWY96_00365 [Gaiellaceae bacterium]